MSRQNVSVIFPALVEQELIGYVVESVPWSSITECIVVDNGSSDGTAGAAARIGARVVTPIETGEVDVVMDSRLRGHREPGSMLPSQIFAGRLVALLLRFLQGLWDTDMGPFRAIDRWSFAQLGISEITYGWNLERQVNATKQHLRIRQIAADD